ncbi:MAG: hypothetical protein JO000_08970, partial [Alphaproteobacteria bacterium]|nr:hypothetical protein [Alphaproteobacteria bacterium]
MRGQRPGGHGARGTGHGNETSSANPRTAKAENRAPCPEPRAREPEGRAFFTPDDVAGDDYAEKLGSPGSFPFTRGLHASGYGGGGNLWTMRLFAGF